VVFHYTIVDQTETAYPVEAPPRALRRAVKQWFSLRHDASIERYARRPAEAHLGFHSAEVSLVCADAKNHEDRLVQQTAAGPGECLFHTVTRLLEPVGYSILRLHGRPKWYWLVGRGDAAIELSPRQWPSPVRLLLWTAVLATVAGAAMLVAALTDLESAAFLADALPAWGLLMGTLLALGIEATVLRRLALPPDPYQTLVVLRGATQPSPLLPCLATVGSHTHALHVADRTYAALMNAMLAPPDADRQSTSLSIRLANGNGIRLLEVASPQELGEDTCQAMVSMVDGILLLEEAGQPVPPVFDRVANHPDRSAALLRRRWTRAATWAEGELPLDLIQSAYVEDRWDDPKWCMAFDTLWAPLAQLTSLGLVLPALPEPLTDVPVSAPLVPMERSPMRWLTDLLFPRKQQRSKIPILGVEGCGKSSLIVTLAQYISLHQHGHVSEQSLELFAQLLAPVQAGRPLRATVRYSGFEVFLQRVPERDGTLTDVDLVISSEDIPGQEFRMLVGELTRNPELQPGQGQASDVLQRFSELLSSCQGFIFVIDLLRQCTPEQFRENPRQHTWAAYSDQVKPIMTGILLAAQMNASLANKPMFFVLSKPDLHRLGLEQLESDFRRAMAIPLAALRARGVRVRVYSVQCAGWRMDSNLEGLGADLLLADLAHAVGSVTDSGS